MEEVYDGFDMSGYSNDPDEEERIFKGDNCRRRNFEWMKENYPEFSNLKLEDFLLYSWKGNMWWGKEENMYKDGYDFSGSDSHTIVDSIRPYIQLQQILKKVESPIEVKFAKGIMKYAEHILKYVQPQINILNYRVDFLIKKFNLIIELDGHEYHKSKLQRTNDAQRERNLKLAGYEVIRFTGTEIHNDIEDCINYVLKYIEE